MVAQAYLGRQVNIEDEGKSISGIVDAVNKMKTVRLLFRLVVKSTIHKKFLEYHYPGNLINDSFSSQRYFIALRALLRVFKCLATT